jgi:D-alanyl-D-alanine carboxypeptidase/D-alanyl-D-alanine-endopeptidase (penicillin-binding protein 4)
VLSLVLATALATAAAAAPGSPPGAPAPPPPAATPAQATKELRAALDRIVQTSALRDARAGVFVARIDDGEVVYAHDPDALLNPASNVKLFTAAAALARLGPEHRFETEFWLDAPRSGAPALHVRGKGDPSLTTERLWAIVADLKHRGLREVREIVVDDAWFDPLREGPGYDQEQGDRSYLAPTGAVSLNYNAIAIHVAPGDRAGARARVEVEPESDHVVVDHRATTGRGAARRRVKITSTYRDGRQHVRVEGRVPLGARPQVVWRKIDDPPAYFAATLRRLLELRGVKVSGRFRLGPVPASAKLLHVAESEPLGEIARRLNKHSNNFVAEQIVKALGAQVKGPPGTWPKGIAAIEEFLAEAGIPRGAYVMKNGSGLNDANRFSARQTVTLLRAMWRRFPVLAEFLSSLPIAGRDGTIRWRMGGSQAEGMLRAKTGTLEGVTSLSGYVETAAGDRLAFAVLVNDFTARRGIVRAVDAVGGALAAAGRPADLGAAVAEATPPPAVAEPLAQLRAHVATWYQLAETGDRRNAALLRTALRSEEDPVVRMAIAEAIYLSEPDAGAARRAFLENLALDATSLARLRELGAELRVDAPVLGSLAELASDGSPEALGRLVEAAPAAGLDDGFAALLAEVAGDQPDALLKALRGAPAAATDATLSAIARGDAEPGRAAPPLLLRAAELGAGDEGDPFARELAARLEDRVRAERALRQTPAPATIGPAKPAVDTVGPARPAPRTEPGAAPSARK